MFIQSKNEIVKETFLFCSIEGFRFPGFMKHNKLKFSSGLEFFRCFAKCLAVERDLMQINCLDSGPLFLLFRVI